MATTYVTPLVWPTSVASIFNELAFHNLTELSRHEAVATYCPSVVVHRLLTGESCEEVEFNDTAVATNQTSSRPKKHDKDSLDCRLNYA